MMMLSTSCSVNDCGAFGLHSAQQLRAAATAQRRKTKVGAQLEP